MGVHLFGLYESQDTTVQWRLPESGYPRTLVPV